MSIEKEKKCPFCGKQFRTDKNAKKYCSLECQQKNGNGNPKYNAHRYQERKKNPEWIKKRYINERERHKKVKLFLRDYKLRKGCVQCGYNDHHAALQFDHIKGVKSINVCYAKSITHAEKEIEKCEVVCANCHQIRTFVRLEKQGKTL